MRVYGIVSLYRSWNWKEAQDREKGLFWQGKLYGEKSRTYETNWKRNTGGLEATRVSRGQTDALDPPKLNIYEKSLLLYIRIYDKLNN